MPSFQLSPLTPSDIPSLVEADDLATRNWPVAHAMDLAAKKQGLSSRKEMIEGWMNKALEHPNPYGEWVKITDQDAGGRFVGAAAWTWHLEGEFVDRPPPSGREESSVFTAMRQEWSEFREEFFKDVHWYHLQTLFTHPDYQRQGAGTLLVKYGCDKADEAGVMCTLQATAAGLGLYLKNGFEIVKEREMDLRPFGVDASELRRWMVRKPKAKA